MGSRSWEGREKRTEARSATPMNLRMRAVSGGGVTQGQRGGNTNFLRMPMKMRSLELSLWLSSAAESVVAGGAAVDDMLGRMREIPWRASLEGPDTIDESTR